MQFELTEALIDDILFSMEDQDGEFMIDTVNGVVSGGIDGPLAAGEEDESPDTESGSGPRYISLPEWDSASGFRLMERFVAGHRNPLVREELSSALSRGKGVFRAFKNTLSLYPEVEKLWFSFKEREMKREIVRWYNGLREEWGLEKIGMEPEETGDLVLEDFRFRPFRDEDTEQAAELHNRCMEEYAKMVDEKSAASSAGILVREAQVFSVLSSGTPRETAMTAESIGGEFAGYISGIMKDSAFYIRNLEIKAEFRGLGIGEALLSRLLDSLDRHEVTQVLMDLPSWAEGFSRVLLRESFKPYTVRYWLRLRDRMD